MAGDEFHFDCDLRQRVRTHLETFERRAYRRCGLKPAAVAVTLLADDLMRPCFVLTRRAARLRTHSRQWALPGGRLDAGESAEQAAVRELAEEVGLELGTDRVLGLLDDYPTRSGYVITPVVIWAPRSAALRPNPCEVAEVYRVPLAELEHPDVPQVRRIPESIRPVISIPLMGTNIHAPTAAVLYQLREVAVWGRNTRVAHFEQPVFAWS
ncbi:MAG TPA: CoA pyrophosphatase [Candidatus Limnocylindrales bacterium]|nr:CoA pyrophosphatase [Candidatus Limnocylindrales bacterium]